MTAPTTVFARFAECLDKCPDATAIHLVEIGKSATISYAELYADACRSAAGLARLGLKRGDRVLLALATGREVLGLYLGALATGIVPILLPELRAPGSRFEQALDLAKRVTAHHVVVAAEVAPALRASLAARPVVVSEVLAENASPLSLAVDPSAIAHLQPTSGSTNSPKLAVVRHGNIAANVSAIGIAIGSKAEDRVVSWLPLFHDMGLICISCALYWGCPLVLTDSANFVRNPLRYWLELISTYRGTISPAPTSAYQTCVRLTRLRACSELDLTSWRVAFCGAEPVHRHTLDEFSASFSRFGLRPSTLLPVYGLAEATLAVSIPPPGRSLVTQEIDMELLEKAGKARPAAGHPVRSQHLVALGGPLPNHHLRITDEAGRPLADGEVGEIEVSGPSIIDGYWQDEGGGLKRPDGFLRTGDLGFIANGELYVTGRSKDVIILQGRNLLPSLLERVVDQSLDFRIQDGVAALGITNEKLGTEELHLLVESRQVPPANQSMLEQRIREVLDDAFAVSGFFIHWLPKGALHKTTSGKIQRSKCRDLIRSTEEIRTADATKSIASNGQPTNNRL